MKPAVLILAAGASERLGRCKALVPLGGRSVLARLLDAARAGGALRIALVAGAHQEPIAAALGALDPRGEVLLVPHPDWRAGRTGSLARGAAALPDRDLLVAPVDVPLVGAQVFRILFDAWERAGRPARGWLAPRLGPLGRHGHPVLLGRDLAAEALGLDPATPLRVLRARAVPLLDVEVLDPAILDDLDGPLDLDALERRLGGP